MPPEEQRVSYTLDPFHCAKIEVPIAIFGPEQSGKSTLMKTWNGKEKNFKERYEPTIGAELHHKKLLSVSVKLKIWDLAGPKCYFSIYPMYYRQIKVGLCCFDLSNLDEVLVNKFITDFQNNTNAPLILIGNVKDFNRTRSNSIDKVIRIAKGRSLPYLLMSAKEKLGFGQLEAQIINTIKLQSSELASTRLQKNLEEFSKLTYCLPPEKKLKIQTKLYELHGELSCEDEPRVLSEILTSFVTECHKILGKHPLMERLVKLAAIIVASALTAFITFSIGFLIGLGLCAWSGPAALITAFATGSAAAYLVVTAGIAGAALVGGVTAHSLFIKPNVIVKNLSNQLEELQQDFVNKIS